MIRAGLNMAKKWQLLLVNAAPGAYSGCEALN